MRKASSKKLYSSKRCTTIASLLQWLEHADSFTSALSKVLTHFPVGKRPEIERIICSSVDSYRDLNTNLADYFEGKGEAFSELSSFGGHSLEPWVVKQVRKGEIWVLTLNALCHRKVVLLCQVERMSDPSSYLCARHIRAALYGLILSVDSESEHGCDLPHYVEEYDRVMRSTRSFQIPPLIKLKSATCMPNLHMVPEMAAADREAIICDVLGVNKTIFEDVPSDLKLVLMVSAFWVNNANPRVKHGHLMALLLCILKFAVVDQMTSDESNTGSCMAEDGGKQHRQSPGEFVKLVSSECTQKEFNEARYRLRRFTTVPRHKHPSLFDSAIVHAFSQFQACLLATTCLNYTLCCPILPPRPARVFNGTFLYNVMCELKTRRSPATYMDELLSHTPTLAQHYARLHSTVSRAISDDAYAGQTKKKKKPKQRKRESGESDEVASEDSGGDNRDKLQMEAVCELSNRFDLLLDL